eukprot:SAG11_NODE_425_length_9589_cov_69.915701_3_plen_81_part_00
MRSTRHRGARHYVLGLDTGVARVRMVVAGVSKFIIYILPGSAKFSRPTHISTCEARIHLPSQFPNEIGKEGFNTAQTKLD